MTTLAPTPAGVLHRTLDKPKARQPAHDRRLPRHDPAASSVRRRTYRHATERPRYRRPRRAANRRVPRSPRARAWQRRAHPQRPPCGYQIAVSLRRAQPPRARRNDPAGPVDPTQALPACTGQLPHRGRARRAAGRPRPNDLDRSTRPRPDPARRPDRAARLRADRAHLRRPLSRRRPTSTAWAKSTQATNHTTTCEHGQDPARVATRTRRAPPMSRCSQPAPAPPLSRRRTQHRLAKHDRRGRSAMPGSFRPAGDRARIGTLRRCGSGRRSRHLGDRAPARPRGSRRRTQIYLHADLALKENALARTAQPTAPGRYHPPEKPSRSSKPLIMPTPNRQNHSEQANPDDIGKTRTSEQDQPNQVTGHNHVLLRCPGYADVIRICLLRVVLAVWGSA